ncbi:MAG TPA: NAD(P)H-dependent oxidoreductase [Gemmatimonadales bacterium]|jgi:chromate reductase
MAEPLQIIVLVGSLRRQSVTRKVAHAMMSLAPASLALRELDLAPLAMYNADLEEDVPAPWAALRRDVKECAGVLFFTPEYNRSVPGVLKNAIDIASRPGGRGVWNGKPGGVVSVTPFGLGAFGANHHLRQALVYVNVPTMAQPEAYVSRAADLFDKDGVLVNDASREFFTKFMNAFAEWVDRISPR